MCSMHMPGMQRDKKRALDALELEMVLGHYADTRN